MSDNLIKFLILITAPMIILGTMQITVISLLITIAAEFFLAKQFGVI